MKRVIKFWDKVIVMLLGMTGMFVGCNKIESDCGCEYYTRPHELDSGWTLYGPGPGYYVIQGAIVNQANLQPIPNIQVVLNSGVDIFHTNSSGNYAFSTHYQENPKKGISIKAEDIDGKENGGHFATKEVKMKFTEDDKEKMEKCNQNGGTFVKIQNIELKKK